jgi:hypothetical protein
MDSTCTAPPGDDEADGKRRGVRKPRDVRVSVDGVNSQPRRINAANAFTPASASTSVSAPASTSARNSATARTSTDAITVAVKPRRRRRREGRVGRHARALAPVDHHQHLAEHRRVLQEPLERLGVAVQVAFESNNALKPGYHIPASSVETRAVSGYGFNVYSPTSGRSSGCCGMGSWILKRRFVAVHFAFLKATFEEPGYHIKVPRVEARRVQAMGQLGYTLYSPAA